LSHSPIVSVAETNQAYGQSGLEPGPLRRRLVGIGATLLAEIIIIALLLTLGWNIAAGDSDTAPVVTFEARTISSEPPPSSQEDTQQTSETQAVPDPQSQPVETPVLPEPTLPQSTPLNPPPLTLPEAPPAPPTAPAPPPPAPAQAAPQAPARTYGPPDTGPQFGANDSKRVGTAPNGEPLYAARWYREPTRQELAGYLSTATAPASALIACRTVPDFYVEDCELLGESPRGSQIGRAVLAAAWQFRVRPAIIGGRSQVGSWVRIRIDYTTGVRR